MHFEIHKMQINNFVAQKHRFMSHKSLCGDFVIHKKMRVALLDYGQMMINTTFRFYRALTFFKLTSVTSVILQNRLCATKQPD